MSTTSTPDPKLALLRHAVATLAYRGGKPLRGSPTGFADFRAAPGTRTPVEILAHVGDLLDWAASQVRGENYVRADIVAGRVGAEQSPPALEFG